VAKPEMNCESYARECVRLAGLTEDPQLREALMQMAREWMAVVMEQGGPVKRSSPSLH
jgi:hypothetical protein